MATMTATRVAEIRKFAVAVGCVLIGFTLVASGYYTYQTPGPEWILRRPTVGGFGVVLMALGYLAPALLDWPEKMWMKLAHFLGYWNTRILLSLTFYLVLLPLGLMARMCGWDDLKLKKPTGDSYYDEPPEHLTNPKHFEHPF